MICDACQVRCCWGCDVRNGCECIGYVIDGRLVLCAALTKET